MNVKVYLVDEHKEEAKEIFTYGEVVDIKTIDVKTRNQYKQRRKKYYVKSLKEIPKRIDKYIGAENVVFIDEPKVYT